MNTSRIATATQMLKELIDKSTMSDLEKANGVFLLTEILKEINKKDQATI